ncbi:hypothetical protein VE01_09644 [Pseudogymnoascus verrucosus]|uniref:Diacetyl reductase [(S)-acetoin forming] n=1 Tax=Pseudogymnoascus verrucosus TaxID=342668 RepID=A0A1B8G9P4_9PEZI|nr:uncharacterized protein VE01_09644 [Pseudogymnoascus verrucosus]OBT92564.1 hypothetical protein VE01_09644 [Pseudogymnoascus verrucosus]
MPVAIVTGSSRGIGRAIALQLADDGMDIAINDIEQQSAYMESVKAEVEKKGRRAIVVVADVSVEEDVKRLVDTTVEQLGELNVMVSNAGIIVTKRLFEVSVAEWDKVQQVNVRGMFLCYREAGRQMIAQGKGGKIIGAASIAAFRPFEDSRRRLLWNLQSMELMSTATYCPGPVSTDMWDAIDASVAARTGLAKGEAFERSIQSRSAMKKAQTPEDIANMVSFLASDKARMITGQSMIVDGGIVFS